MSLVPSFFGRRSNIFDPVPLAVWDTSDGFPSPSSSAAAAAAFPGEISNARKPSMVWKDTSKAHVIKADLPGLKKEEVKIVVEDGNILRISGERNSKTEEKTDTWHRVERRSGKFLGRFRLPENAEVDHVTASMENSVLTVTVPKLEVKKPKIKSVDISD